MIPDSPFITKKEEDAQKCTKREYTHTSLTLLIDLQPFHLILTRKVKRNEPFPLHI